MQVSIYSSGLFMWVFFITVTSTDSSIGKQEFTIGYAFSLPKTSSIIGYTASTTKFASFGQHMLRIIAVSNTISL